MERSNIFIFWLMVLICHALLCQVTAENGNSYSEEVQQPQYATGNKRLLFDKNQPLKSNFKLQASHSGEPRNASKKGFIQRYEDPDVTVTVTETQYVTTTVTPEASLCYLTTTQTVFRYETAFTEAPTATETATTQATAFETATTLQLTVTDTETTTQVISTKETASLTTQTVHVTTATTELPVTDTSTVYTTVITPFTVTSTAVTTRTPLPIILVVNKKKRDFIEHQRYRRVRRSWYIDYVPNFVKKWIGMNY